MVRRVVSIALVLAFGAGLAMAQSLGEAAARQREKREKKARPSKPARVFTNDDLGTPSPAGAEAQGQSTTAGGSAPSGDEGDRPRGEDEGGGDDGAAAEASWKAEAALARQPLTEAEQQLAGIDGRMTSIRQQLNPMNPSRELDTNRILALQAELTAAEAERQGAQSNLEEARRTWEEFLDNARRSGIPTRWRDELPR